MISRHGVGHLPCHTLSDLTEPKLLFSVLCLFRPPEGLTWRPRGIYNHSRRTSLVLLFKILIQPKKFFTGPGPIMKPLNQCHTLGVILLASVELVNSVQYTDFNQRPPALRAGRSPVAFKGKFTDNENHLVFDVQPRYLPTGSLPMFAN